MNHESSIGIAFSHDKAYISTNMIVHKYPLDPTRSLRTFHFNSFHHDGYSRLATEERSGTLAIAHILTLKPRIVYEPVVPMFRAQFRLMQPRGAYYYGRLYQSNHIPYFPAI